MKREEKNEQTRQRILAAAMEEFGARSFGDASLNSVCTLGGISKGIIYHYFEDKDGLYLACVGSCFDALTAHLKANVAVEGGGLEAGLGAYFDARTAFFSQNPLCLKLFCSAVFLPPPHLAASIAEARRDFDGLTARVLTALLEGVPLRDGLTVAEVVAEFRLYQDFINAGSQVRAISQVDLAEHEKRCSRSLNILLYGVIERKRQTP